jgi:hypothetical protein
MLSVKSIAESFTPIRWPDAHVPTGYLWKYTGLSENTSLTIKYLASYRTIFQCPGLRKHPGVGLDDLLQTQRVFTAFPGQPNS